jgi:SGNH hydrolase-like domain, acetyltransferase AlgX
MSNRNCSGPALTISLLPILGFAVLKFSRTFRAGYLLPRVLVFVLLCDLGMRVLPLRVFAFRALEAAQRRLPNCMGPFENDATFRFRNSYGDLASMGNLRSMRQYRNVTFTTDQLGFHNNEIPKQNPDNIILGDSFAIASEVQEDESFSSRIAQMRGSVVYNAAEDEPLMLAPLRSVVRDIGMHRGYVIYEFLERHLLEPAPPPTETGKTGLHAVLPTILGAELWDRLRLSVWHIVEFSPMQAMAQKIDKFLCNGWLLPNRYSENVLAGKLVNGDALLFTPTDLAAADASQENARGWVEYWSWLSTELQKSNLTLVVVLVPNKYTVYSPLLAETDLFSPSSRTRLPEVERMLDQKNVLVVNLVAPFRSQAERDISSHQFIYWIDDTHWNERGMHLAAAAVSQRLAAIELVANLPVPASPPSGLLFLKAAH